MSTIFAKAFFPLLLLSGGGIALAGCSTNEAPRTAMAQPTAMAEPNNTGESPALEQSGATGDPCAHVAIVSPRENGLGGHQMPPACDEYLESHPNLPSLESGANQ